MESALVFLGRNTGTNVIDSSIVSDIPATNGCQDTLVKPCSTTKSFGRSSVYLGSTEPYIPLKHVKGVWIGLDCSIVLTICGTKLFKTSFKMVNSFPTHRCPNWSCSVPLSIRWIWHTYHRCSVLRHIWDISIRTLTLRILCNLRLCWISEQLETRIDFLIRP